MHIKYNCPSCDKLLKTPMELEGKIIKCPHCQTKSKVPSLLGDDDPLDQGVDVPPPMVASQPHMGIDIFGDTDRKIDDLPEEKSGRLGPRLAVLLEDKRVLGIAGAVVVALITCFVLFSGGEKEKSSDINDLGKHLVNAIVDNDFDEYLDCWSSIDDVIELSLKLEMKMPESQLQKMKAHFKGRDANIRESFDQINQLLEKRYVDRSLITLEECVPTHVRKRKVNKLELSNASSVKLVILVESNRWEFEIDDAAYVQGDRWKFADSPSELYAYGKYVDIGGNGDQGRRYDARYLGSDEQSQLASIKNMTDQNRLFEIANSNARLSLREHAVQRMNNFDKLFDVAMGCYEETPEGRSLSGDNIEIYYQIYEKIATEATDDQVLYRVVMARPTVEISQKAIMRINSKDVLGEIEKKYMKAEIKKAVRQRLAELNAKKK